MSTLSSRRGYTLIELIVSVGLFSIVMLVAMAAFLTLIDLDRKARATNDVVTNLSYVVDSMARSIRTGTSYDCALRGSNTDCVNGHTQFNFTNSEGQPVTYLRKIDGTIGQCVDIINCTSSNATSLTDPRITIETLMFYVQGSTRGDTQQPRVLFTIAGSVVPHPDDDPIEFIIESSATQRLIDL